jgi:MoxR-like ATPase
MAEELKVQRQEENSAAVRDLSTHIIRLMKERDALLEKRKKLITLSEAKAAIAAADDLLLRAIREVVPDYEPQILQLQAEYYLESDLQPFDE